MRLLRSSISVSDLNLLPWDGLASSLCANNGGLGDLGGGNHFLDALVRYDEGPVHFLLHTGLGMSGQTDLMLDLSYNTYEQLSDGGVIIRKGSVQLCPGEVSVLPSHMSGDVVLIRAMDKGW
jgi:hypothetical protein